MNSLKTRQRVYIQREICSLFCHNGGIQPDLWSFDRQEQENSRHAQVRIERYTTESEQYVYEGSLSNESSLLEMLTRLSTVLMALLLSGAALWEKLDWMATTKAWLGSLF